ncbi:MAG: nucleotidyltransferase domain-containing protein [candidate division WOR-3 bacterium]
MRKRKLKEQNPTEGGWVPDSNFSPLDLAREYALALKRRFGRDLVSVVVYGSSARNDYKRTSDIDLIVVVENLPPSLNERLRLLGEIEDELQPIVDSLHRRGIHTCFSTRLRTPDEARRFVPIYLDMTEDAVFLHDENGFFQGVLAEVRARLGELGARRVRRGRLCYWELKPDFKWGEVIEL